MIVDCLNNVGTEDEGLYVEWSKRQRLTLQKRPYVQVLDDQGNEVLDEPRHVLNEAMLAEKDPSTLSIYRMSVDGQNLGKFRSSGIICASGTGSTAWLYSAKRITAKSVNQVK